MGTLGELRPKRVLAGVNDPSNEGRIRPLCGSSFSDTAIGCLNCRLLLEGIGWQVAQFGVQPHAVVEAHDVVGDVRRRFCVVGTVALPAPLPCGRTGPAPVEVSVAMGGHTSTFRLHCSGNLCDPLLLSNLLLRSGVHQSRAVNRQCA